MNETCKSKFAGTLPWIITLGLETLVVIVANIVTIFVFCKNRYHLKKTSLVLINLSVADLMVGISTIEDIIDISEILWLSPASCTTNWTKYLVLEEFFGCASISFLVLVSLKRLYAIVWPFRSRTHINKKLYSRYWNTVWLLSGTAPVLELLRGSTKLAVKVYTWFATVYGIICLIAIICAYFVIWIFSKKKDPRLPQSGHQKNKHLANTLFIVTLLSLITWLPLTVAFNLSFILESYSATARVCRFLQLANSFINPIIYCFRMPMFRRTLKTTFLTTKTTGVSIRERKTCSQMNVVVLVAFSNFN